MPELVGQAITGSDNRSTTELANGKTTKPENIPFEFLDYHFDKKSYRAIFRYRGGNTKKSFIFTKISSFSNRAQNSIDFSEEKSALLDRALFLSFVINGTSYYKAFPSPQVKFSHAQTLTPEQANFFNHVYQDGLSQFAYENHLTRANLAHFNANNISMATKLANRSTGISQGQDQNRDQKTQSQNLSHLAPVYPDDNLGLAFPDSAKIIALQSGGKDSLLTAALLNHSQLDWSALYASTSGSYPKILDEVGASSIDIIQRNIDLPTLQAAEQYGAMNGHVPVTYINLSLALIQAILDDKNTILTSIGHEGEEPHSVIHSTLAGEDDLVVNHQWSKTASSEDLFQNYVTNYISPDFLIYSPLRHFSELKIAELFAKICWKDYGHKFSSCNVINYGQRTDNSTLRWCGRCAKCANSYLLFAPFIKAAELNSLFPDQKSLFEIPELTDDFKGLLGIEDNLKPFECVGEIAELRYAYHHKLPGYPNLPFAVPPADFDLIKN